VREDKEIKSIRPIIPIEKNNDSNELELFQNEVLRPILKYQHDIIIQQTSKELIIQKKSFRESTIAEKRIQIKRYFISQPHLKYFFFGQICGLMTDDEFDFYLQNKKELDKRIASMLTDRILSYYA
jgi:hypothetical protein